MQLCLFQQEKIETSKSHHPKEVKEPKQQKSKLS